MTVTVTVEDKSVQKPPVIMQEVFCCIMKKQTVPRFSVALAMKNKTPFDMTLKVFVSELKKLIFFENLLHRTPMYDV